MSEILRYKYLPDADGFSYSGRWRAFLRSASLPLKATIFAEWHDSRLVPWRHFVPMDNTFIDWWGIMEYFAGYDPAVKQDGVDAARKLDNSETAEPSPGAPTDRQTQSDEQKPRSESLRREPHDEEAEKIAISGAHWAERVLRKEDMLVYMYRLFLEYARICDDRREQMAWVGDLPSGKFMLKRASGSASHHGHGHSHGHVHVHSHLLNR